MRCFAPLLLILPALASAQQSFPASELGVDHLRRSRYAPPLRVLLHHSRFIWSEQTS
jgi:hypothetical protein